MEYLNTCRSDRELLIKWACMNENIKNGDYINGKVILLNIEKINRCVFYPTKKDISVTGCWFIRSDDYDDKSLDLNFNRMKDENLLSMIIKY